jgi:hypothetical protein
VNASSECRFHLAGTGASLKPASKAGRGWKHWEMATPDYRAILLSEGDEWRGLLGNRLRFQDILASVFRPLSRQAQYESHRRRTSPDSCSLMKMQTMHILAARSDRCAYLLVSIRNMMVP